MTQIIRYSYENWLCIGCIEKFGAHPRIPRAESEFLPWERELKARVDRDRRRKEHPGQLTPDEQEEMDEGPVGYDPDDIMDIDSPDGLGLDFQDTVDPDDEEIADADAQAGITTPPAPEEPVLLYAIVFR